MLSAVIIYTNRMKELAFFYSEVFNIQSWEEAPGRLGCLLGSIYFGFDSIENCDRKSNCGVTLGFEVDDIQTIFRK